MIELGTQNWNKICSLYLRRPRRNDSKINLSAGKQLPKVFLILIEIP